MISSWAVWVETSFDEISVKQPRGCQSRYCLALTYLTLVLNTRGHGATISPAAHEILTQLQGVPGVLPAAGVMLYIRPVLQIYSFQELYECFKYRSWNWKHTWEIHCSFQSEFRQGHPPRCWAFGCFSWNQRCCASIWTLVNTFKATAHLKQWFQLFLVAQLYHGKFVFQLLRHTSGVLMVVLVFFLLIKGSQIPSVYFKQIKKLAGSACFDF